MSNDYVSRLKNGDLIIYDSTTEIRYQFIPEILCQYSRFDLSLRQGHGVVDGRLHTDQVFMPGVRGKAIPVDSLAPLVAPTEAKADILQPERQKLHQFLLETSARREMKQAEFVAKKKAARLQDRAEKVRSSSKLFGRILQFGDVAKARQASRTDDIEACESDMDEGRVVEGTTTSGGSVRETTKTSVSKKGKAVAVADAAKPAEAGTSKSGTLRFKKSKPVTADAIDKNAMVTEE
ncbi:predicted protein [Postia placenta Mad-698-R]|uniref:Uncharacterized protein n=1 Tax=Postia placenta MAD-698-R-SB12 TaxID=670580 RepID=A0A1X6MJZ7_9APHY|nr:hypothetical protein POSPLADRAFT_1159548 [Postia placenta MAD-698-R-SB12]EED83628.1 predicted protein [Postia placenta Mad-698-R]OSX56638.1 hypothetical protein POSPLADRAFT_1159548 [Postia placenta MAD-698-R-SB12]